jgi:hypothetical protein
MTPAPGFKVSGGVGHGSYSRNQARRKSRRWTLGFFAGDGINLRPADSRMIRSRGVLGRRRLDTSAQEPTTGGHDGR